MKATHLAAAALVIRQTEPWLTNGFVTRTCLPADIAASAVSSLGPVGIQPI